MKRRKVLGMLTAGLTTGVGCLTGPNSGEANTTSEGGEDTTTSGNQFTIDDLDTVSSSPAAGFSLTLERDEIQIGGTLNAQLQNISSETKYTGSKHKYTIHKQRDGTWESVFKITEPFIWEALAYRHEPGEGFSWNISITSTEIEHPKPLRVTQPVEPGLYRFVFFGFSSREEIDAMAKTFRIKS